jgi:uncharacterized protein YxeA
VKAILTFIMSLLLAVKEACTFLDNKQQHDADNIHIDAGKVIGKEEAISKHEDRKQRSRAIDVESDNRTDDFKL